MELVSEIFYPQELISAEFEYRKNRFVAVVKIDDISTDVHVPTTSRMKELLYPGAIVFITDNPGLKRLTRYDLKAVLYNGILVSIDSGVPNRILRSGFENHSIISLHEWSLDKCEVTFGKSRLDFRLINGENMMYIEAKSVTLVNNGCALFPDAPTSRGTRHLYELIDAVKNGYLATVIFIIQREDAVAFSPNINTDPMFANALKQAYQAGVKILPLKCCITMKSIKVVGEVPVNW